VGCRVALLLVAEGRRSEEERARREWYRRWAAATTLSKDALVAILLIWAPFIAVGLVIDLAMAVPAIGTLVALCVVIVIVIDAVIRYSVQRPSLTTGH
jgi:hypothetical protein